MKLNKNSINELRRVTEAELCLYAGDELVKFDKDTLEMLLFDYTSDGLKYPIWTGYFLRKVDLSEISFDNVLFDAKKIRGLAFRINLSETNANIDFMKIHGSKISNCDFMFMDLTKSNFHHLTSIEDCCFCCSKIRIKDINVFSGRVKRLLASGIKQELFNGAYINGKRISLPKERKEKANELRKEYKKLEEDAKQKILGFIHKN